MPLPMLADFAVRLAGGLAAVLVVTPWRVVPPRFFRTHCQVILGLGVLACLATSGTSASRDPVVLGLTLGMAALAFVATILWGLGLPRLGAPTSALIASVAAVALTITADGDSAAIRSLSAASRIASAALLGATLTAMLLGHYYLTAPAMSIEPLKRFVRLMAVGLLARAALAGATLLAGTSSAGGIGPLFVAIRWGVGLAGFGVATYLAWRTVQIRSTQSATGILYIAMTLLLFGELSSLVLARSHHVLI